jgi:molybdate transport system substrate-binding protein
MDQSKAQPRWMIRRPLVVVLVIAGLLILAAFALIQLGTGPSGAHPDNAGAGNPEPTTGGGTTPAPPAGAAVLSVFAASSLQDGFTEAGKSFGAANPGAGGVQFNFAGSQTLVTQLAQGAPADVFASADKATMDKAAAAGVIVGAPQELARNVLVVGLPGDNPAHIAALQDLARPGLKIALADPSVPVGNYSLQALDKLAADPAYGAPFKQQVLANVVSHETNVRQVLTRVQLGEADAGIVYSTDALAPQTGGSLAPVKTLAIPDRYNVVAVYYVAAVKGAPHAAAAQAWITYLLSDAGQAVLTKYGFLRASGR